VPARKQRPPSEATHIQRVRGPGPAKGEQRVLWLIYAAPLDADKGQIVDIVEQIDEPDQYLHLCRLPTIVTNASGYNAWLVYAEQHLDQPRATPPDTTP
jgi:hypothetical protein